MTSILASLALPLLLLAQSPPGGEEARVRDCLDRVRAVHGGSGPWAVVGYRMGERALKELDLPRQSFSLLVVHRCPAQVQYSCMADGLQAATGASPGKLNLKLEEVEREALSTVVEDRKKGRKLVFTIRPELAREITDLPYEKLASEGERIARLPDDRLFIVETKTLRK